MQASTSSPPPSPRLVTLHPILINGHDHNADILLQHWAHISANGATSIEDLNNSTLHFTDVNGSSMTGTTSQVIQQMVDDPAPLRPLFAAFDLFQVGVIGENLVLRRCGSLYVPEGLVLPYVHNSMAPGMGTIGVLLGNPPPLCACSFLRCPSAPTRCRSISPAKIKSRHARPRVSGV
jgi:hypothetical protein